MSDDASNGGASSPELAAHDTVVVIRDSFGNRRWVQASQPGEPVASLSRPEAARGPVANPGRSPLSVPVMHPPAARPGGRRAFWGLLALGSIALLAFLGWSLTPKASGTTAVAVEQTRRDLAWSALEIRADGRGRVLEVSGPDSAMVLQGYCEPWPTRSVCEAIKVTETHPPQAGVRLGIFRNPGQTALQAIRIERSRDRGRWVAGGDGTPLKPMELPDLPEGTPAIPVSGRN